MLRFSFIVDKQFFLFSLSDICFCSISARSLLIGFIPSLRELVNVLLISSVLIVLTLSDESITDLTLSTKSLMKLSNVNGLMLSVGLIELIISLLTLLLNEANDLLNDIQRDFSILSNGVLIIFSGLSEKKEADSCLNISLISLFCSFGTGAEFISSLLPMFDNKLLFLASLGGTFFGISVNSDSEVLCGISD